MPLPCFNVHRALLCQHSRNGGASCGGSSSGSTTAPGLCIAAIPEREDPRDAFLSRGPERLEDLPPGATLGTASLRRQAQSLHRRPDLKVQMLRGNVDTRLGKLAAGEADAILLAYAGLRRLGLGERPTSLLDPKDFPPAPGQGA